jgi:hypothetical protein
MQFGHPKNIAWILCVFVNKLTPLASIKYKYPGFPCWQANEYHSQLAIRVLTYLASKLTRTFFFISSTKGIGFLSIEHAKASPTNKIHQPKQK